MLKDCCLEDGWLWLGECHGGQIHSSANRVSGSPGKIASPRILHPTTLLLPEKPTKSNGSPVVFGSEPYGNAALRAPQGLRRKKAVPDLRFPPESTKPIPYGTPARPYYAALRKNAFASPASSNPYYIDRDTKFPPSTTVRGHKSVKQHVNTRLPSCFPRRRRPLSPDERRLQAELGSFGSLGSVKPNTSFSLRSI